MDFPEKAIIGVLGELAQVRRHGEGTVRFVDHELDRLDRVAKQRAVAELEQARLAGGTVVIASYDEELLAGVCDEVWWIVDGETRKGSPEEILRAYRAHAARELRALGNGQAAEIAPSLRRGDGRAKISGIELLGESGQPTIVWSSGEPVRIRVSVRFERPVEDPVIGMLIRTRIGLNVYGTNTEMERLRFGPCAAGELAEVTFGFRCDLCPGEYTLTIASHDPDGVWHEWLEDAVAFSVSDSRYTAGVANLRAKVEVLKR
jgi:lipopolysaccharide transport system ATP-binding protein